MNLKNNQFNRNLKEKKKKEEKSTTGIHPMEINKKKKIEPVV